MGVAQLCPMFWEISHNFELYINCLFLGAGVFVDGIN